MSKTRILVVEDEAIIAEDIRRKLEGFGYEVPSIALSGEEAVRLVSALAFDLILMDVRMPGKLDGVDAAAKIREEHDIPVVYLTAFADKETVDRAKMTGPFGYIIKPFTEQDLLTAIEIALYKHGMEAKLQQSEAKYRTLFNRAAEGIMLMSTDGTHIFLNQSFARMHGYGNPEEMKDLRLQDLNTPETGKLAPERLRRLLAGESMDFEVEHYRKDGSIFPLNVTCNIIQIDGQPFFLSFHSDITAHRQAEAAVAESEKKYRALVETTETGFLILDGQGKVLDANPEYVRLTGHRELREILGRSVVEWTAEHEKQRNAEAVARCAKDGFIRNFVTEYVDGNGRIIPVEINATVNTEGESRHIISLCRDITERKRAEDELRKRADELERFNNLMVGRELRMVEMKKEINAMLKAAGKPEKYTIVGEEK